MNIDHRMQEDTIENPKDMRITFRQAIGSLIWASRTRSDIGHRIALMATSSVGAWKSPPSVRDIRSVYN